MLCRCLPSQLRPFLHFRPCAGGSREWDPLPRCQPWITRSKLIGYWRETNPVCCNPKISRILLHVRWNPKESFNLSNVALFLISILEFTPDGATCVLIWCKHTTNAKLGMNPPDFYSGQKWSEISALSVYPFQPPTPLFGRLDGPHAVIGLISRAPAW